MGEIKPSVTKQQDSPQNLKTSCLEEATKWNQNERYYSSFGQETLQSIALHQKLCWLNHSRTREETGAAREEEWGLKPVDLLVMSCVNVAKFFSKSELA